MDDPKERTITEYNKNPEAFDERFQDFFTRRQTQIDSFVSLLPGKRVLDLCCGSGVYGASLMQRGLDVTGVDIADGLLSIARQRGMNAIHMDIEALTFPDASFDGIFANAALLHTPKKNMPAVLASLHRVLGPKGVLYVSLREGEGEGYTPDAVSTHRYFVHWKQEELLQATAPWFTPLETYEIQEKHRWLFGFFRKV